MNLVGRSVTEMSSNGENMRSKSQLYGGGKSLTPRADRGVFDLLRNFSETSRSENEMRFVRSNSLVRMSTSR